MPESQIEEPKRRLSPYRQKREAFPDLVLKARDREMLLLVHEYRFLTTDLIWRLLRNDDFGPLEYEVGKDGRERPKSYGFGQAALYKRLQALFHAGYLVRHFATDQPIGGPHGSPRAIYGLGPKAAPLVAQLTGSTAQDIRRVVEANRVKSPFLRHALALATFRAALNRACAESNGHVALAHWEQGMSISDHAVGPDGKGGEERFSVYPDAFFALFVRGKGSGHYFLEVDRGTMPIVAASNKPDLRKKVLGYRHYREFGRYKRRYRYPVMPDGTLGNLEIIRQGRHDAEADNSYVPISGFRVLFIVPGAVAVDGSTSGRLANVLAMIRSLGPKYATSTLFWLAPDSFPSIDHPDSIFAPAWITPNPARGLQSLID